MHSSLAVAGAHHKSIEGNRNKNFLVRWFYQYYWFFGYLCVGAEFTYLLLYLRLKVPIHTIWSSTIVPFGLPLCTPGCVAKQLVNVAQLATSCYAIAAHDARDKNSKKAP
jgi:hypothetical protein